MTKATPTSDLPAWIAAQRWFATKTQRIHSLRIEDTIPLAGGAIVIVAVSLDDGSVHRYALTLGAAGTSDPETGIVEAFDDPVFCRALLDIVERAGRAPGGAGEITGHPTRAFPPSLPREAPARRRGGEQSNTSVVYGDALILKQFRRVQDGVNPEQEITRFLTERTDFPYTPRLAGHLEYRAGHTSVTLAVLQELVPGARDGWEWMLEQLGAVHERARQEPDAPATSRLHDLAAPSLRALRVLGSITAALHVALASRADDPAFAPEAITDADIDAWARGVSEQIAAASAILSAAPGRRAGEATLAIAPSREQIAAGLAGLRGRMKIRHHGDFHLGQTLYRDGEFMIIDFEGEPLRPLAERRRKHVGLRDVAGMLRSLEYAAAVAARASPTPGQDAATTRHGWLTEWTAEAARTFLEAYRTATRSTPFGPVSDTGFRRAVAVFELEKAAYEIVYEANNRPDWLAIPARGFASAAARLPPL